MNVQLEPFFNLNSAKVATDPATVFIYGLNDPVTGKCRYVGKAVDPQGRFSSHLSRATDSRTHKNHWVQGLAARGLKPVLEVLEEVPASEWEFWEREYIRVFRMVGFNLTNLTDGGDGGAVLTEDSRAKINAKISAANLGKKRSPEARAKLRETRARQTFSEETRAKISAANRGKKRTPETCARMSAAASVSSLGRKPSEETKLKLSEALKAAWKIRKFSAQT